MSNARSIKRALKTTIREVSINRNIYCINPKTDFTRNRKLSFEDMIKSILCMGGKSLNNELIEYFKCNVSMPTTSAFVQQREKIKPEVFEKIFRSFTSKCNKTKLYKGYQLVAVDGSDIQTPHNTDDEDSLCHNEFPGTYNLYHLNALYDLNSNVYLDAIVQKKNYSNEHKAFVDMVDRFDYSNKTIFIADRGYESFNNMAHVQENGQYFLFRFKDCKTNGILSGFDFDFNDTDEFDIPVSLNLTRKQNKETKDLLLDKNHYRCIPNNCNLDYLPKNTNKSAPLVFYNLSFRLVRIKISDDNYELIATNLGNDFNFDALKSLYSMRWGIETSFRHLKYTVGLLHFHSKKQSIFSKKSLPV